MHKRLSARNKDKNWREDLQKIREVLKLIHLAELFRNERMQPPADATTTTAKASSSNLCIMQLKQFSELIIPQSRLHSSLMVQLSNSAEHVLRYLNADDSMVAGTTYGAIWQLLKTIDYSNVSSDVDLMNNIFVAVNNHNGGLTSDDSYSIIFPVNTVNENDFNISQSGSADAKKERIFGDVRMKIEDTVNKSNTSTELIEPRDNVISEETGVKQEESDEDNLETVDCSLSSLTETAFSATTLTVEPQMYDDLIKISNCSKIQIVDGTKLASAVFNKDVLRSYNRTCPFCSKVYCSDVSLRAHLFTHSAQKPYACPSCPRRFTQNAHRSEHVRRRHSDERPYVCMCCHGAYASASHLRLHLRTHGIALEKRRARAIGPFPCNVCGQELANRQTLASHRHLHTGEKPIVCPVCGLTFHDPAYFWRHRQKHLPSSSKPTSKQASTPCTKCGRVFGSAELMRVHQRVHSSRRPYICAKCGDAFKRPGDLRLHDRTHTGHKPYKCETCGVCFTQAHSLKNHIRCHTNERPHSCSVCSKAFRTADKLRVHFRVHSGERPHICTVCSFSFADRSALRRHLKRHEMRNETGTERAEAL